jgi:galactose-1-phosphate uridylyltransferase
MKRTNKGDASGPYLFHLHNTLFCLPETPSPLSETGAK